MRKMAYIVEVSETLPIKGKDRIQIIKNHQNGYSVIGSKDIKVGDKLIYVEVDSILPEAPEFEFLRAKCYKPSLNGFLIKNLKMFKIYSNGLLLKPEDLGYRSYRINEDFTERLKIRKHEVAEDASPVELKLPSWKQKIKSFLMHYSATRWLGRRIFVKTKISGDFPTHLIAKSDEDNIQNNKHWFDMYKNDECYISCKCEGQSLSLVVDPKSKKFAAYNRNSYGNPTVQAFVKEKGYEKILKSLKTHYAVQGEFCHPTVQKGIYKNGSHFYVYLVKNLDTNQKLSFDEMMKFCKENGFETVPIIYSGKKLCDYFDSVEAMQEYTEHIWFKVGEDEITLGDDREQKLKAPEWHRSEGIVIRNLDQSWSFKVKSNEYQLAGL